MKRTLLGTIAIFVLIILGSPVPVEAAIALTQHVGKDAGNVSSTTIAFPTGNAAGNFVAVVIRAGRSGAAFSVSDTRGNTYRQAALLNVTLDTPLGDTLAIYYAENIAAGTNTVTVTQLQPATLRLAVLEYSGVSVTNSLDGVVSAQSTSLSPNSGNLTTTSSGDLLLGAVMSANDRTFTAGASFTIQDRVPAAPYSKLITEDRIQSAAGSAAATATLSATDVWGAALAAFRPAVSDLRLTKSHTGSFVQGQTGAIYSLIVSNAGVAPTTGTVTLSDTLPSGLTATAMSGTGWTCTVASAVCTRGDALASSASYPAITVTVNVAANAPASVTNTATVSGGGQTNTSNDSAADVTTINPAPLPDLILTKTHSGAFIQGQTGAAYTVVVSNSGPGATIGTVTMADALPTGLTATALAGTGWTCTVTPATCTRSSVLASGASYPAITVTVNVAANAPASLTNIATASGGGETNTANSSTSDITTINPAPLPDLTLTKTHSGTFTQGQTGVAYAVVVSNSGPGATNGTVTMTDALPIGLTATTLAGTGWTCTVSPASCSRSDVLASGASYPVITVTVNVAANAPTSLTNIAAVGGGGQTNTSNDGVSDLTTINPAPLPDLTLTKTHNGAFAQGQTGAVYTVTVTNNGPGPTSGTVTMTDELPNGLTATALAGTGWSCSVSPASCSRSDVLASGASYPAIAVTVSVAANAAAAVTNIATVSGGGESNTANNSASDFTSILTGLDTQPPTTPGSLSATPVSGSQINVAWSPSTDNVALASYRLERCQGTGCSSFSERATINAPIMGPLRASPNPNYFMDAGGTPIVLNGSHTWNSLQDWGTNGSVQPLDFTAFVDFLVAHGHNFTLLWRTEFPKFCGLPTTVSAPSDFTVGPHPWLRSGPGTATDGRPKFDLSQFDQAYFDRLRARVQALKAVNIYAGVYLFSGEWLEDFRCATDGYPFSGPNNVNGIDDGTGIGSMTMTGPNASTDFQDAYVRKVIDTLNDLPNVMWIVSEEAPANTDWWHAHQISVTRSYESSKPYQHPVGYGVRSDSNDGTLLNSAADWISPFATISPTTSCGSGTPACKVNINDSDHSLFGMWNSSAQSNRNYAWQNFTNGNQVVFMDPYVVNYPRENRNICSTPINGICSAPDPRWDNFRDNLGRITSYSRRLNLSSVTPKSSLCSTANCLAQTPSVGAEYLVYSPSGGSFTVNLSAMSASRTLVVEWFNPSTGAVIPGANVPAGSTARSFTPPFSGDAVLYLVDSEGHAGASSSLPTSFNDTGLESGTSYSYRVLAIDTAGNASPYSNVAGTSTPAGSDLVAPTAPGSLSVLSVTGNQIGIAWSESADNVGVTGYIVERCQGAGCSSFGVLPGLITTLTFGDSGLSPATSYSYRVRAADAAGNLSLYSSVVSATTSVNLFSDLTLTKSHSGNFVQGQNNAIYVLTARNSGGVSTSGTATLTDTLPAGLTATAMSGSGWNCTLSSLTCTQSASIAAGTSYPPVTVIVSVAANAPASVTNTANISGGGEVSLTNNVATDVTVINAAVPAAITLVQHSGLDAGNTTTSSLAFPTINTAGNWIGVMVRAGRSGQAFTVTDTRGNVYRQAVQYNEVADDVTLGIFYAESIAGGANTVTVTDTLSGGTLRFAILEYSGIAATSSLDGTRATNGTSATPSSGTIPTTTSGALVLGLISTANPATFTAGPGFVIQERVPAAPNTKLLVEDQRVGAAGLISVTATLSASDMWGAAGAAFRPAPASGGGVPTLSDLIVTTNHSGSFNQGQTGATYSLTVTNVGTGATSGTISVTDTLPSGLTATAISGAAWSCTLTSLTCTQSSAVASGASLPPITVIVNVAANAPGSVTNTASVSGGGETNTTNNAASDVTAINVLLIPDLTLAMSHTGAFTQGQTGATYSLIVHNGGIGASSGPVTVVDSLPAGMTATAISGTGWTCTLSSLTCTRSSGLAAAADYPAITLTVNVALNAPGSLTNSASVSGGGEANTTNNAASDVTAINVLLIPDLTLAKSHTGAFTQGQTGATYSLIVHNGGTGTSSGTVTVVDLLPDGMTATEIAGTGWTCTLSSLTCTRSSGLAANGDYPTITLTVDVASNAPVSLVNTATVSGGGETNTTNNGASDTTVIDVPSVSDLTITKVHAGTFTRGQLGATYTLTVTNNGVAATSGTVTVVDTLPAGLTSTAISGGGWNCTLASLTCTRTNALAAGASYPVITVAVNVAGNAPLAVTNNASVTGGGETNITNNTAGDLTTINATDTESPGTPGILSGIAPNGTHVDLSWGAATDNLGVTGYRVERCDGACTVAGGGFVKIAAPTSTSFSDSGLVPNTVYSYVVRAEDAASNLGPYSNVVTLTTLSTIPELVVAFSFDEPSGASVTDSSGKGNTGTIANATRTQGKYGNALSFNGTNAKVSVPDAATLHLTTAMTLEAWVNPGTVSPAWRDIIEKGDDNYFLMGTSGFSGAPAAGGIIGGVNVSAPAASAVATNTWTHLAATYDGATLRLYVGGVEVSSVARVGTMAVSTSPLEIGGDTLFGQYFQGLIDEVRVYNIALTPTQIASDMNRPIGGSFPIANVNFSSLGFGNISTGIPSAVQHVTLTNSGGVALSISAISVTGANSTDFSQSSNCGASLAAGANCTIAVTFTPATTGARIASLRIDDNAAGSPHLVSLTGTGVGFSIVPRISVVTPANVQQFGVSNGSGGTVQWAVDGIPGGSETVGTISSSGLYSPPQERGTHTVSVTDQTQTSSSMLYVTTYPGKLTHHNDNARTGQNLEETVLTPANVNPTTFGKLLSYDLDGLSMASPLYVAGVAIPGQGVRNVVFVATQHDSVYAFDADGLSSTPLWKRSFLGPGVTTVPSVDTGECCDIAPEIGITGTPVIDPAANTLYVVAKTKEGTSYFQRLHALDITTGAEKPGGWPITLQASVPGNGQGSSGGQIPFNALRENQRPALLLNNGVVYIAFGAHGDVQPYHGWVLGYNVTTLQQTMAVNLSPNADGGGIWQANGGPAADSAGNIYVITGNGAFTANSGNGKDFGDSFVKISTTGASAGTVVDYFTPYDQASINAANFDLGAAGPLLLPDQPGAHPHLLVSAGKNNTVYLIDRDNMGHINSGNNDNQIVQSLVNVFPFGTPEPGNYSSAVYFNGRVYFGPIADNIQAFQLSNGLLSTTAVARSQAVFKYPGATMSISANGSSSGLLWAIQRNGDCGVLLTCSSATAGVLRAYDTGSPGNVLTQVYSSDQMGTRDAFDFATKFSVPLVANGKVFVSSMSKLTIFGLLP